MASAVDADLIDYSFY